MIGLLGVQVFRRRRGDRGRCNGSTGFSQKPGGHAARKRAPLTASCSRGNARDA